ncbi:MAG: hypothetical protein KC441_09875, partial [Anaerolineales bacterium]|nr:hypothetical protein [Anaerolineales bacterium]
MRHINLILALITAVFLLAACDSGSSSATQSPEAGVTTVALPTREPTQTPMPTATAAPTIAPSPTPPPEPTAVPTADPTPEPTAVPEPT